MTVANNAVDVGLGSVRNVPEGMRADIEHVHRDAGDLDAPADLHRLCEPRKSRAVMRGADHCAAGFLHEPQVAPDMVGVVVGVDDRLQLHVGQAPQDSQYRGSVGRIHDESAPVVDGQIDVVVPPDGDLKQLEHVTRIRLRRGRVTEPGRIDRIWQEYALGVEDPTVADDALASMSAQSLADLTGSVLRGRYRVAGSIGSGSMGDVYDGVDLSTGGRVALKVLKPERAVREVFRHRFLREAKSAVLIDHPNVVDVLDYGETPEGLLFIAMEFLEGEDLSSYLKRNGRLQWPHAVSVLSQVAAALAAAHDCGVVHRDVKPSNILLRQDGSGGLLVKLLDFGVAKLDNQMVSRVLTRAEDVVGTVLYMSPEQAEGRGADLRSDVYAFGVTAFQTLTGNVPFPGRDLFKVMSAHLTQPAPDPAKQAPDMPPWGSRFVLRCLEKVPEARYQSMHDVLSVLAGKATPDIESQPRPGTPITDPNADPEHDPHPPLTEDPVTLDPRGPTLAGGAGDEFDDAPTAYFQAARTSSPAEAPSLAEAPRSAAVQVPPTGEPSTMQASAVPAQALKTLRAAPVRVEPSASPFGPQDPLGGRTVPSPMFTEDPAPYEPRPSRGVYVLTAMGVLLVVGALAVVVGGW